MASPAWTLTGNAGTDPKANSLGTTDNEPLIIKTNGAECIRVNSSGNVGFGTANPTAKLYVNNLDNSVGTVLATNAEGPGELRVHSYATQPTYVSSFGIVHAFYNDEGNGFIKFWRGGTTNGGFLTLGTSGTERLRVDSSGNVGIGTSQPSTTLHVAGNPGNHAAIVSSDVSANLWTNQLALIGSATYSEARVGFATTRPDGSGHHTAIIKTVVNPNENADLVFQVREPGFVNITERMRITSQGNVGIGTSSPTTKLHVVGDITATGDVLLSGADCAEEFDIEGEQPEPGTVVVIDEIGSLRESLLAYDRKVAGVVSGAGEYKHAILLDRRSESEGRVPVALVGKVYCKVDAQYSRIEVGDLLTTSPTPGHAMKAVDPLKSFGCVIGKALTTFEGGQGLIPVLIALQ